MPFITLYKNPGHSNKHYVLTCSLALFGLTTGTPPSPPKGSAFSLRLPSNLKTVVRSLKLRNFI